MSEYSLDQFKEKYIEDIESQEELDWLMENSYLNNLVYYGKTIQLLGKNPDYSLLRNFYDNFETLERSLNMHTEDDIKIAFDEFVKFFEFIGSNFNFISNNEPILEAISRLYYVLYQNYELKFSVDGMQKIWHRPLVRDVYEELPRGPIFPLVKHAAIYAENGDYYKAYILLKNNKEAIVPSGMERFKLYYTNIHYFYGIKFAHLGGYDPSYFEALYTDFIDNNFDALLQENDLYGLKAAEFNLDQCRFRNNKEYYIKKFESLFSIALRAPKQLQIQIPRNDSFYERIREPLIFIYYYKEIKNSSELY